MSNNSSLVTENPVSTTQRRTSLSKQTLAILLAAVCLLCTLAAEEWLSIRQLSTTYDESAHLYAGYQHWTARDFGVNPEHPPLAKMIAALPLLGMKINPSNPPRFMFLAEEYAGGEQMLAENGNYRLLTAARMAASFFTFALALLVLAGGMGDVRTASRSAGSGVVYVRAYNPGAWRAGDYGYGPSPA